MAALINQHLFCHASVLLISLQDDAKSDFNQEENSVACVVAEFVHPFKLVCKVYALTLPGVCKRIVVSREL